MEVGISNTHKTKSWKNIYQISMFYPE